MSEAERLLVRYLRQRRELGAEDLLLDPETLHRLTDRATGSTTKGSTPAPRAVTFDRPPRTDSPSAARTRTIDPGRLASFEELASAAAVCTRCGLADGRTQVVFGDGDPGAELVVVGEAPGAEEDRTGRPFVGRAGKLLDLLLLSAGFPRKSVYICNVLKCRPPGNRNPKEEEVEACSPFLRRQIELIAPKAILAVGTFPAQTLLAAKEPISRLRGSAYSYEGVPLVPTYHPAALLRNPTWIRPVWEDLQRLRRIIDG